VFTARYALSPYIKQIRLVFKGLTSDHRNIEHKWCVCGRRVQRWHLKSQTWATSSIKNHTNSVTKWKVKSYMVTDAFLKIFVAEILISGFGRDVWSDLRSSGIITRRRVVTLPTITTRYRVIIPDERGPFGPKIVTVKGKGRPRTGHEGPEGRGGLEV
jgi:hypothetical protein